MSTPNLGTAYRTLRQMNDSKGNAYPCFATENLWVGYGQRFSDPAYKNQIVPLTTGKAYFDELIKAINGAQREIYITGWQVNWDALLATGVRLFDVLLDSAKRGCKIYVMPWDDTGPGAQTYDDETRIVLLQINSIVGREQVEVRLANTKADQANSFYSHHQKLVVVDREIAFVGGIDLAYGRYDDASFSLSLIANSEGREAMNRYNGCVPATGQLAKPTAINPVADKSRYSKTLSPELTQQILNGGWQVPLDAYMTYGTPKYETLDPQTQPRLPWQDVQVKITGSAVIELTRNFVYRWNELGFIPNSITWPKVPQLEVPAPAPYEGMGLGEGAIIQVLRSASAAMRLAEYAALPSKIKKDNPSGCELGSVMNQPSGVQDDILRAMEILIDKAQHFIYIENQFFVSAHGTQDAPKNRTGPAQQVYDSEKFNVQLTRRMPGAADAPPQNDLCRLLAARIGRAILDFTRPDFHVYITLPVYSEGRLDSGAIITQIHWTMQSLVFGSMSLLNRIRRCIRARELYDINDPDWGRVLEEADTEYKNIKIERCFQYVTLLNLRNWDKLGSGKDERYVTEQIYVHSKVMIVDDRFALVGSANINDRSLLGGRDSELSVLVMDTVIEKVDFIGDGKLRPTRSFARKLRKDIWKKLFGITSGVRPATELMGAIDKPADPKSWQKIQAVAAANTKLYEAAFDWVPQNKDPFDKSEEEKDKASASIWPRWHFDRQAKQGRKMGPMPFDKEFWDAPQHKPAAAKLTGVKGFITLLPIEWTKGENNNIGYHTMLVTEKKQTLPTNPPTMVGQVPTDGKKA